MIRPKSRVNFISCVALIVGRVIDQHLNRTVFVSCRRYGLAQGCHIADVTGQEMRSCAVTGFDPVAKLRGVRTLLTLTALQRDLCRQAR